MGQSRIEDDLLGYMSTPKSRIEQILNGEQIVPRSRIESALLGYNPEDPGDYHKVECTKAQYDNMSDHDEDTLYIVTYLDDSVHIYLGDAELTEVATPAKKSDVTLYDYDGTIIAGYTAAEFAEMTELPAPPEHELLTFTGWNYSLADAKAYVAKYGEINIGAVYRVTDGKTRIFITLGEGRLSPVLGLGVNGSVDVDWGDGTAHGTLTGSSETTAVFLPHTYATAGDYVIAITPGAGSTFGFVGDNSKGSLLLTKGENATGNALRVYQNSIKKVLNGDSVTSIGAYAFSYCFSLTNIIIPGSVTSIETSAFRECRSLTNITIPDSVTSIGKYAFYSCYSLTNIIIPDSVTSIEKNAFDSCCILTNITIPDSVTSIGSDAFASCYSLTNITIPDSVTSIVSYVFYSCFGLGFIKFESATPPTVSSASAFSNVSTDCIIYVPRGYLEAYEGATNYPDPDVYRYVEY